MPELTKPQSTGNPYSTPRQPAHRPGSSQPSTSTSIPKLPVDGLVDIVDLSITAPETHEQGSSRRLPPPLSGKDDIEPGNWSNFMMSAPFKFSVGVKGNHLKGKLLPALLAMSPRNEPVLRDGWRNKWDDSAFFSKVNSSLANVEALAMQCVGKIITDPKYQCMSCSEGDGPFDFCARVEGIDDCSNCHWKRNNDRCSFLPNTRQKKLRRAAKLFTEEELTKINPEIDEFDHDSGDILAKFSDLRRVMQQHHKLVKGIRKKMPSLTGLNAAEKVTKMEEYLEYLHETGIPDLEEGDDEIPELREDTSFDLHGKMSNLGSNSKS
ncbi:uncharacterized protein N7483_010346 [Penicillium malachiteum]|uniref:uncharacterized protein n=1 Tax=Penicillium malachiteum TaxID=1324776 RepID=UPI002546E2B7|nr:uncharacterized protein N7483_010346 [Penicillium malachiteum]KAJ5713165.1 hypothetical protein N7483_010346 [Penicillium malachiteum]